MRPVPRVDCSVSGRSYSAEYPKAGALMQGSFWLELNNDVTLALLPSLPCAQVELRLPDDVDVPRTREEAFAVLALTNMHVVVCDEVRAGQTLRLTTSADNDNASPVFFFVSSAEWDGVVADAGRVASVTHGYQPSTNYRDEFPFLARFVAQRVLKSEFLDAHSRALLSGPLHDDGAAGS